MRAVKKILFSCFLFVPVFPLQTVFAVPKTAIVIETCPFFDAPEQGTLARGFFDKRDSCEVDSTLVDSLGTAWFHVCPLRSHKNACGWVIAKNVVYASDIPADFASRYAAGDQDKKRRLEILKSHQQWPRRIIQAVRNGRICLDMSEEQVVASWGEPAEKRKAYMVGVGDYLTLLYGASLISVGSPNI
jgi:hypothetical protein